MNNAPLDLVARFARKVIRLNQELGEIMQADQADQSAFNAIPSLGTLARAMFRIYNKGREVEYYRELYHHYELLNKDAATHKALRFLAQGSEKDPVPAPLTNVSKHVDFTISALTGGYLTHAFNSSQVTSDAPEQKLWWSSNLLTGLAPGNVTSSSGYEIMDYFQVNPMPFRNGTEPKRVEITLEDPDTGAFTEFYASIMFQGAKPQSNSNVHDPDNYALRVPLSVHVYRRGQAHWVLQTQYELSYDRSWGLRIAHTQRAGTGVYNMPMNQITFFQTGRSGQSDLDLPAHWENLNPLSEYVDVYDEVENVIHYGTAQMVPRFALRDAIHRWLLDTDYWIEQSVYPNAQVAKELLEIEKKFPAYDTEKPYYSQLRSNHYDVNASLTVKPLDPQNEHSGGAYLEFVLYYDDYDCRPMQIFQYLDKLDRQIYSSYVTPGIHGFRLRIKKDQDGVDHVVLPDNKFMTDRMLSTLMVIVRRLTRDIRPEGTPV